MLFSLKLECYKSRQDDWQQWVPLDLSPKESAIMIDLLVIDKHFAKKIWDTLKGVERASVQNLQDKHFADQYVFRKISPKKSLVILQRMTAPRRCSTSKYWDCGRNPSILPFVWSLLSWALLHNFFFTIFSLRWGILLYFHFVLF